MFEYTALRHVEGNPLPSEDEATANGHKDKAHKQDYRPGPNGEIVCIAHGDHPDTDQRDEDTGGKEREAEKGKTPPKVFAASRLHRQTPDTPGYIAKVVHRVVHRLSLLIGSIHIYGS